MLSSNFSSLQLVLTISISREPAVIDAAYEIPEIYNYVDFVNVIGYNYHTYKDNRTGHNAPLYSHPDEIGEEKIKNVNYTMQYLLNIGALPEKTVLGVPFFGQSFKLINKTNNALGDDINDTFKVFIYFDVILHDLVLFCLVF